MLARCAATLCVCLTLACGDDDAAAPDAATPPVDGAVAEPDAAQAPPADAAPPAPDAAAPVPGGDCRLPLPLVPGDPPADGVSGELGNDEYGSCSLGSSSSPDVIYAVDVGATARDLIVTVTVDEAAERPFDVVLYGRTECEKLSTEVGCADGNWGERLELLEVSGLVFVMVDGTGQYGGDNDGAYQIAASVRDLAVAEATCDEAAVTSRCAAGLRCVGGTCAADSAEVACAQAIDLTAELAGGTATVTGATHRFAADHFAGSCAADAALAAPEQIYRIDLAAPADLTATTESSDTRFDTYLYLRRDACAGAEAACHDDIDLEAGNLASRLEAPGLAAGTYYLFVDGSSPAAATGAYRLTVTVTP